MEQITIHAKLVAEQIDGMGYTNYVFEDLNPKDEDFRYIMCVRFPNWEQKSIEIDEIGYLNIRYVEGGKDTWFDGQPLEYIAQRLEVVELRWTFAQYQCSVSKFSHVIPPDLRR